MEQFDSILEIDGVSSVLLNPDGKCIITLKSPKFQEHLLFITKKINQLNAQISETEKRIKKDDVAVNTKLRDLNNLLLKERFDGIKINMESMLEALKNERGT